MDNKSLWSTENGKLHSFTYKRPGEAGQGLSLLLAELKECRDLQRGRLLHRHAVESFAISNKFVINSLISMYSKCGSMVEARNVFDTCAANTDVVSWSSLLQGYVENGQSKLALELFDNMENSDYVPNERTFTAALGACASLAKSQSSPNNSLLVKARSIHSKALANRCCDIFVETKLVDTYASCRSMRDARRVFDGMLHRNIVSWNALLQGYVENGESELGLEMFDCLKPAPDGCTPNARTFIAAASACGALASRDRKLQRPSERWLVKGKEVHVLAVKSRCCSQFLENALINMYGLCGSMGDARKVFNGMTDRDLVSWNALILGYVNNNQEELALQLVDDLKENRLVPDSATYLAALTACGNLMAVEKGQRLHGEIQSRGLDKNVMVANNLIDFYVKCGDLERAKQVFDSIARRTVVSWNSLMHGYSSQGETGHVFELFKRMKEQGVSPDEVTFVCVLTACSHAGLTEKGMEVFTTMSRVYGVRPSVQHYSCMVDLLGRANCLEEAVKMVRSMPFEADEVIWTMILGACNKWNNVGVGRLAYESLLRLNNRHSSTYVMMANIYKNAGMGKESAQVAAELKSFSNI